MMSRFLIVFWTLPSRPLSLSVQAVRNSARKVLEKLNQSKNERGQPPDGRASTKGSCSSRDSESKKVGFKDVPDSAESIAVHRVKVNRLLCSKWVYSVFHVPVELNMLLLQCSCTKRYCFKKWNCFLHNGADFHKFPVTKWKLYSSRKIEECTFRFRYFVGVSFHGYFE